ncbi:fatty acid cis/trans isomerase [Alteromonas sp. Cnat2-8]|uniref:fatty acid cis/trans isomerase n=1 Tax=Alteromonas sp. Cnat2-8 TaxID=2917728 RepID=UPI001EF3DA16|nr:fatty acid cis/trans isomerase [Alteromonas sp. Cnat2-8]MCG7654792.1 fatty acid cis/trans isomerase [Alteromonas sp. Cnat2-8]
MISLLIAIIAIAIWQWPKPDAPLLSSNNVMPAMENLPDNFFDTQVNPVLTQRCVVCHACYDAPCQLKMSSPEGIARGANKEKVYEGTRLTAAQPNRMFLDAHNVDAWRERGFFDVLESKEKPNASPTQSSVLAQMLLLKKQHPLPNTAHLGDNFDISLSRQNQCPTIDEMGEYIADQPLGGMPYALPALSDSEHTTLVQWLNHGAPLPSPRKLSQELNEKVSDLEAWLNGDSNKMQLSARYIYEHLFTSHLYFEDISEKGKTPQFFNLVRSRTPPGQALDIIATRRPFDDPKVKRVYYRLQPVHSTIVSKTHQAYAINKTLMDKWQSWFVDADFSVETLPSYKPEVAANPLTAFTLLPVESRYRFMLERAQNTIMGYIKGPVCRGQVALNVINDRFWVFFVDPDIATSGKVNAFYASQKENLHLPAEKDSSALAVNWVKYAKRQSEYMRARTTFLNSEFEDGEHLNIPSIWDGDGGNTNASLTVFRHFDNATVVKGMVGNPPKTAWVIDYALLERIHYLLVAGFDVYGNYGHQLMTRLYMDFLRMEGESNFLNLLPPTTRHTLLNAWYQKASPELTDYLEGDINSFEQPSGIAFETDDPQQELYQLLSQYLAKVQPNASTYNKRLLSAEQFEALDRLDSLPAQQATLMPETTMIVIQDDKNPDNIDVFTALRNSAHYNVNSLFEEEENREPSKDSITLVHGVLGSYPDAFWYINASEITSSIEKLKSIKSEADYKALLDDVGMRRTNPNFWAFSDKLMQWSSERYPIEGGLLDYNRLEDR